MEKIKIFPCVDYYSLLKKFVCFILLLSSLNHIYSWIQIPENFDFWLEIIDKVVFLLLD